MGVTSFKSSTNSSNETPQQKYLSFLQISLPHPTPGG